MHTKNRERARRKMRMYICALLAVATVVVVVLCAKSCASEEPESEPEAETPVITTEEPVIVSKYADLEDKLAGVSETFSPSESDLSALKQVAQNNPTYKEGIEFFIEHVGAYSQDAVNSVIISPEKTDFVLYEPFAERTTTESVGSLGFTLGEVPLLFQYDERWANHEYGSSVMGYTACGPTCLSMAAAALIGDGTLTPPYIADFAEENGYYIAGYGTDWRFFSEGAQQLGMESEMIMLDENAMRERLDSGAVLILSLTEGDFTFNGHFVVVRGYNDEGFLINDPNSEIRSAETWSFDRLSSQIAGIWALSGSR